MNDFYREIELLRVREILLRIKTLFRAYSVRNVIIYKTCLTFQRAPQQKGCWMNVKRLFSLLHQCLMIVFQLQIFSLDFLDFSIRSWKVLSPSSHQYLFKFQRTQFLFKNQRLKSRFYESSPKLVDPLYLAEILSLLLHKKQMHHYWLKLHRWPPYSKFQNQQPKK